MPTKLYVIILVFISLGSECSILSADNYLVARIYCSIRGYDVEVRINDILFKDMSGNVGCALHIFDKKHPLSKKLSEKSRGLFCLTGGNNDIEIAFKIIEGAKENYIKI